MSGAEESQIIFVYLFCLSVSCSIFLDISMKYQNIYSLFQEEAEIVARRSAALAQSASKRPADSQGKSIYPPGSTSEFSGTTLVCSMFKASPRCDFVSSLEDPTERKVPVLVNQFANVRQIIKGN